MNTTVRFILVLSAAFALHATASERMALIIGNGAYQSGSTLPNPPEDAKLVSDALRATGFEVITKTNANLVDMRSAIEQFQTAAQQARAQTVAVYYAGHGVEVKGQNYLIPVDADVRQEYQVSSVTLPLIELMGALDETGAPLKIVVLDCCRDNPLGRSFKRSAVGSGLAALSRTPEGTVIAYATAPGQTALDGDGKNSPFAAAFGEALRQPGLSLTDVFQLTIGKVKQATNKEQQPWLSLNYEGKFYFLPGSAVPPATVVASTSEVEMRRRLEKEVEARRKWKLSDTNSKWQFMDVVDYHEWLYSHVPIDMSKLPPSEQKEWDAALEAIRNKDSMLKQQGHSRLKMVTENLLKSYPDSALIWLFHTTAVLELEQPGIVKDLVPPEKMSLAQYFIGKVIDQKGEKATISDMRNAMQRLLTTDVPPVLLLAD